jgi:hypothetical protein
MGRVRFGGRFSLGLGLLITAIGAVAILGPEAAHVFAAKTVAILLIATGVLGVADLMVVKGGGPRRAAWTWSLTAVAVGAVLLVAPVHGLASAGLLVGMLLVGHGVAAAAVVLRRWKSLDLAVVAGSLAASLLILIGLALLFGEDLGDQFEQISIGVDMVLFGAYVTLGRELIRTTSSSDRSPSTSSR